MLLCVIKNFIDYVKERKLQKLIFFLPSHIIKNGFNIRESSENKNMHVSGIYLSHKILRLTRDTPRDAFVMIY